MSEIQVIEGGSDLTIQSDQRGFSAGQVEALRGMYSWGEIPEAELSVFFHQAKRTGLDPFARQIYLIGRYSRKKNRSDYTIQVGIDGLRLIADRTGRYVGSDAPVFGQDDYGWWCEVTVYKLVQGLRCPFTQRVYKDDFADERSPMWKKWRMMLGKVAEASSLRKGFPSDMSGLYTHEEMEQSGPAETQSVQVLDAATVDGEAASEPDRTPRHEEILSNIKDAYNSIAEDKRPYKHPWDAALDSEARAGNVLSWLYKRAAAHPREPLPDEPPEDAEVVDEEPETYQPSGGLTKDQFRRIGVEAKGIYPNADDALGIIERQIGHSVHKLSEAEAEKVIQDLKSRHVDPEVH